jgi:hypothetical protein
MRRKKAKSDGRKSPMPFRPSATVEKLIADAEESPSTLPQIIKDSIASLGYEPPYLRNQIINACINAALAGERSLLRLAENGAVSPEVLAEIARRSAYSAAHTNRARQTREAKRQRSRLVGQIVEDKVSPAKKPHEG